MAICESNSSAAIVQHVPPASADRFAEWQRGVMQAAAQFPGYLGTDVYPPADQQNDEWVTVLHFENPESLDGWVHSLERRECLDNRPAEVKAYELKHRGAGFAPWFKQPNETFSVPAWKMALTVLLGLYPTMMLLNVYVLPHFSQLGFSGSRLLGNVVSVALLQWAIVPALKIPLRPWLEAAPARRLLSFAGLAGIVLTLILLAMAFYQIAG
jgi:antibiotic biosynthesis monooxygenase (ABM) superfamily enzyme